MLPTGRWSKLSYQIYNKTTSSLKIFKKSVLLPWFELITSNKQYLWNTGINSQQGYCRISEKLLCNFW